VVQEVLPVPAAKLPGSHEVQGSFPVALNEPGEQVAAVSEGLAHKIKPIAKVRSIVVIEFPLGSHPIKPDKLPTRLITGHAEKFDAA
jgi:hypothetical protein